MVNRRNLIMGREYRPIPLLRDRARTVTSWIHQVQDAGGFYELAKLKDRAYRTWRDLTYDEAKLVVAEGIRLSYPIQKSVDRAPKKSIAIPPSPTAGRQGRSRFFVRDMSL